MSSIASKNLYELLGNDPELDPERATPQPPVKTVDKPAARTGKRNAPAEAPARGTAAPAGGRPVKDSGNANDNYFRDRTAGADKNRSRGERLGNLEGGDVSAGGRGRGRGGRGGASGHRGGRGGARGDRQNRSGIAEHEKQVAHGWGGNDGNAELADETEGAAIAQKDEKDAVAEDAAADADPAVEAEPEDKSKSYEQYLAELAEKKLAISQNLRKANEGSSAKFPEGKAVERDGEEDFIAGSGGKAKRNRERKEKNFVELDGDKLLQPAPRDNFGGRGGRGGRGRGDGRGGRGDGRGRGGEFRGERRGRGEGRGEGRGGRGPRGGAQSGPNVTDSNAFPSLGA